MAQALGPWGLPGAGGRSRGCARASLGGTSCRIPGCCSEQLWLAFHTCSLSEVRLSKPSKSTENHDVPGSSGVWEMDLLLALPLELVALAAWGWCWLGSAAMEQPLLPAHPSPEFL